MDKAHDIQNIEITDTIMHIEVDGKNYEINIAEQSERLAKATQEQREKFVVSSAGYGIHWPEIDEDLSVDGLIGVKHLPPTKRIQV